MMKRLLTIVVIFVVGSLNAQDAELDWAVKIGSTYGDYGYSITTDLVGNAYVVGSFKGTVDFDPGIGTLNLTSVGEWDMFVQKLNSNGNLIWVKQIGGMNIITPQSITTDAVGNIYTFGYFFGTADFDPGAGTQDLTALSQSDLFVQKLDSTGNLLWVRQMEGTSSDLGYSITTDTGGNAYTTGSFIGTVDFDPGVGVQNLTALQQDIFIQKLDSNGNLLWVKQIEGTSGSGGYSIITDASGNVYSTGYFYGTGDFDPGVGVVSFTAAGISDIFIQKLDSNGNLLWVKQIGGTGHDRGYSITMDASGNVYTTGYFEGTVDFNPGLGTLYLTSQGELDIFIQKLDSDGNLLWVKQMGGTDFDYGLSNATDIEGSIYTTGYFRETVDFDPGIGIQDLTVLGFNDVFIQKLDSSGNFMWVKQLEGTGLDFGRSIAIDGNASIYTVGTFAGTTDFDPGIGTLNLTSAGGDDMFIHKLSQDISTSTTGNVLADKFTFYPNPTERMIVVEFENVQEFMEIRLISIVGQTILTKSFNHLNKTQIEINEPKGIYFLEIINEENRKKVLKVIKK